MTHTVATLDVSERTFKEIADKLRAAGYHHLFMRSANGTPESIDMSGIALDVVPANPMLPTDEVKLIGWLIAEGGRVSFMANDSPEAALVASAQKRSYFPIMAHPAAVLFVTTAIRMLTGAK